MTRQPIRVLLVDDHAMVRAALKAVLEHGEDVIVVGETGVGQEALVLTRTLQPAVITMDLTMPGMNGLELTRQLRAAFPAVKVLIVSMHSHASYVREAIQAGATGYMLKGASATHLGDAVRATATGQTYLSPAAAGRLFTSLRGVVGGKGDPHYRLLTARQEQVFRLVVGGLSSKEVGARLGISPHTVVRHLSAIMGKLGVRSRTGLVRQAVSMGLAEAPLSGG